MLLSLQQSLVIDLCTKVLNSYLPNSLYSMFKHWKPILRAKQIPIFLSMQSD